MPLTFLFWNIHRQPLTDSIVRLCHLHSVDVLILAESTPYLAETLLTALNKSQELAYHYLPDACRKIVLFARYSRRVIRPLDATNRATMRAITIASQPEILLIAAHMPDKRNFSSQSQFAEAAQLSEHIRRLETRLGHSRVILAGDLNMNPFDAGLVSASGLHAVMTREIAVKEQRTVQARVYPFFYNPMWGHFGDVNNSPPGTFYYEHAEHDVYFWNMFDQVLIRPALLPLFRNDSLQILQTDGHISFVTSSGKPNTEVASDHLPILFQLDFETGDYE